MGSLSISITLFYIERYSIRSATIDENSIRYRKLLALIKMSFQSLHRIHTHFTSEKINSLYPKLNHNVIVFIGYFLKSVKIHKLKVCLIKLENKISARKKAYYFLYFTKICIQIFPVQKKSNVIKKFLIVITDKCS